MSLALLVLAVATCGFILLTTVDFLTGIYRLEVLSSVQPDPEEALPRVSVIIPARNEQRNLEPALRSVLAQDHPNFEIIAIDDRSTDDTPAILERIALEYPRLTVLRVTELPDGWLGKNHANHLGAAQATGEYLLFTDADIVMAPWVLRKAAWHARHAGLDHLAASPDVDVRGVLLNMFVATFSVFFLVFTRPWKARDPRSRHFIGIGAFNLVRREAYDAVGTHRAIAMRPDDDLKLGKLLKRGGFKQDMLIGREAISVEWYASVGEAVVGLEKNAFAGVDYRLTAVLAITGLQLACNVWPWAALLLTSGVIWWLNAAVVALAFAKFWPIGHNPRMRRWYAAALPLTSALFLYIVWRAVFLTLRNDGLRWRDTHYPLAELKANRV